MIRIIATQPSDPIHIDVQKDEQETFVILRITGNPTHPMQPKDFQGVNLKMPWTSAVLLRNALDQMIYGD